MSCSSCGASGREHLPGCPKVKGNKRGHGKGLLKGEKAHTCRTCDGDGFVTRNYKDREGRWQSEHKTCPDCQGSGTIGE